ncbi:MAG: hypothetical protein AB7P22_18625 [Vicinamibacterales bacterium]
MPTIKDTHGNVLASVSFEPPAESAALVVKGVEQGQGRLLNYYFGRGERRVRVEVGDFELRGDLATRWARDHRAWTVTLLPRVD